MTARDELGFRPPLTADEKRSIEASMSTGEISPDGIQKPVQPSESSPSSSSSSSGCSSSPETVRSIGEPTDAELGQLIAEQLADRRQRFGADGSCVHMFQVLKTTAKNEGERACIHCERVLQVLR